jgi:hypothetical protein
MHSVIVGQKFLSGVLSLTVENINHHSSHAVGFQDRPTIALSDRREERNTGACGNDLAEGEMTCE